MTAIASTEDKVSVTASEPSTHCQFHGFVGEAARGEGE